MAPFTKEEVAAVEAAYAAKQQAAAQLLVASFQRPGRDTLEAAVQELDWWAFVGNDAVSEVVALALTMLRKQRQPWREIEGWGLVIGLDQYIDLAARPAPAPPGEQP